MPITKARQLAELIANSLVDSDEISVGAVTTSKLADTLDFSSKTMVMADDQLSGDKIHGGTVSAFASTGIDDNASTTAVTILSDGKVGIGTDSPQARLHTKASVNNFRIEDADTNGYANIGVDNSGSLYLQADHGNTRSSSFIRFFIDGNEDMLLDEYGQLALTSNPSTFFLGGTSNGSFVKGTNTGNYLIFGTSAAEVARFTGNAFQLNGGGVIKSNGTTDTIVLSGSTGVDAGGNITLHGNTHSNASQIFFKNGSTNVMTIAGGKVGIGTSSPAGKLEVGGGSGSTGVQSYFSVTAGYTDPAAGNASHPGGAKIILWNDTSTPQKASIGMSGNADIWFNNAGAQGGAGFTFYTGNGASATPEARLKITKEGNVGIGDTTPTEGKLVVRGDANTNGLFVGGDSTTGQSYGALINAGTNSSDANFRLYDQTGSTPYVIVRGDGISSFRGGHPNISGSSTRVYDVVVNNGISIGDGGYTHGYIGTNGTDGDVYIAANSYPANLGTNRNVIIATGTIGGGGPAEVVRYNNTDGVRRNYSGNTGNNRKWWSTNNTNFGEVYEYDYGNKLYFKKTRSVSGYTQMLLVNRYMPNQYDVSFELVSPVDSSTYRHFGIALNHVGAEATNFDYLVLRQHFSNSSLNAVRIDRPAGTVGTSQSSSIPNFHDGTKRKIMIQKRASTFRMQVHELNGSVYTYGTISGISWTNSSGYFGFGIYEPTGTNTWAEISNLTFTDVIA